MNHSRYYQVMNDTKWEEIRQAMYEYPHNFHWRTKDIGTGYVCPWDGDWYYHFNQDGYKWIEWLEIKAGNDKLRNKLLLLLSRIHVSGEVGKEIIRIYGYVEIGKSVDYL